MLSGSTSAADVAAVPVPAEPDPRLDRRRHRPDLGGSAGLSAPGRPAAPRGWPAGRAGGDEEQDRHADRGLLRLERGGVRQRGQEQICSTMTGPRAQPPPATGPPPPRRAPRRQPATRRPRRARGRRCRRAGQRQRRAGRARRPRAAAPRRPTTAAARRSDRGASARGRCGPGRRRLGGRARTAGREPGAAAGGVPPLCSRHDGEVTRPRTAPPAPSSRERRSAWLACRSCARSWWSTPRRPARRPRCATCWCGALASELKLDVVADRRTAGTPASSAAQAAAEGIDLVVVRRRRRHGQRGRQRPAGERARRRTCRCWPSSPAARPTSSPARSGRSRDPVEATAEILESLRAGRTRLVSLGTASASGTSTATDPRPERRPRGRRRRRRRRRAGPTPRWFVFAAGLGFDAEVISRVEARRARGTPLHRRALRQGGDQRLPARPRPAPACDDAAGRPASRRWTGCSSAWCPT